MSLDPIMLIQDLKDWQPAMIAMAGITLQAARYTPAPKGGTGGSNPVERATIARERLADELQYIHTVAASTGFSGDPGDDTAYDWLLQHATWGAANGPDWNTHLARLEQIHTRWAHYCDDTVSNWLCPACGTTRLTWRQTGKLYYCPACAYTATPEQAANLRRYVIQNTDMLATLQEACELFSLTPDAIRWHVNAGHIHPVRGLYPTTELRALTRRMR